ncbi:uncharacterized protein LOC103375056, partial [Stegastes partitus]
MSYAHHKLLTWSLPHLLLLPLTYLWLLAPPTGVSADLCRVTGGVLGIHWSSVISLGWYPLADGRAGATCWESCCMEPKCNAVWSLGGRCVLLSCSRRRGCAISSLPQPHEESLGLLQLLAKGPVRVRRRKPRHTTHSGSQKTHTGQITSTESSKLGTSHPTPSASSTITLVQISQKNHSQTANGSSDAVPASLPQNSTVDDTIDAAASSNSTDGGGGSPTAAANTVTTAPTQS